MSLWQRLPVRRGGQGVWDRLAADLQGTSVAEAGLGIWEQVAVLPGGLWSEAKDETLEMLREGARAGIWQAADDETLILERGQVRSLWAVTEEQAGDTLILGRDEVALWEELEDETLLLVRPADEGWIGGRVRGTAGYRPVRALGWALKELETANGEPYWILKNLRQGTYLRLNEQQVYLWKLMDGAHSVQDLAVACFIRFQVLSIEGLEGFLGQLQAKGFLLSAGADVYQAAGVQLWRRTLHFWARRLIGFLLSSDLSIKSVDGIYGALFRLGGGSCSRAPS